MHTRIAGDGQVGINQKVSELLRAAHGDIKLAGGVGRAVCVVGSPDGGVEAA